MLNNIIALEAQTLIDIFKNVRNIEIIPWEKNPDSVGISILKDYNSNDGFIPIKYPNGKNDSVAMIRIWYLLNELEVSPEKKKVKINIKVVNSSRYKFKHHFYNDLDPESPQKDSIEASKKSLQPVDIEINNRYELNLTKGKIYDLIEKNYINPIKLIKNAFELHVNTNKKVGYRIKINVQRTIIDIIEPINELLKSVNLNLFGKRIKKNTDFAAGLITPYKYQDLEDLTVTADKIKILGTEIPIAPRSAVTFVIFFSILYILNYSLRIDFFGIVNLYKNLNNNFFLAILSAGAIILFDRGLPILILYIINLLIRLKWYLITLKINI